MRSIDEAIKASNKVIVICSKNSLQSPYVLREIERALQKENELQREGKEPEVLVPIRLDDYIFDEWKHHRKPDVVQKYIGDYRDWKNRDSYQKEFERLLLDLREENK